MSPKMRLALGAIFFAVFWTLGMAWWNPPQAVSGYIALGILGAVAGIFWSWAMGLMMRHLGQTN